MKKQFNMRIEEEIIKKIEYIAEENERSIAQEITYILKQHIKNFEAENGQIDTT